MQQEASYDFERTQYDKDLTAILDKYAGGRNLYELTKNEVDAISKKLDADNARRINEYLDKGTIDRYTADKLHNYYDNSMESLEVFYTAVTGTLGEPEEIYYENIENGVRDEENSYYLQHISPFTSMTLKYTDEHNNPAYVKLGKMKSLKRVIEKIAPQSKYSKDYEAAIQKTWKKFGHDPALYADEVNKIPKPIDRCNDILRCICCFKYPANVFKNIDSFQANPTLQIFEREIKDKYGNNDITNPENKAKILENPGNHRDFKFIIHLPNEMTAEIMGMTQLFTKYYKLTHVPYEKRRRLEQDILYKSDYVSIQKTHNQIAMYSNQIRRTNGEGFEAENKRILDKIKRMEDKARRNLREPDEHGTYPECVKFLVDNYFPRTAHALSIHSFDNYPAPLKDVAMRYYPHIRKKHLADITEYERAIDEPSPSTETNPSQSLDSKEQQIASLYRQRELYFRQKIAAEHQLNSPEVKTMFEARSRMIDKKQHDDSEYEVLKAMDQEPYDFTDAKNAKKNQQSSQKVNKNILSLGLQRFPTR